MGEMEWERTRKINGTLSRTEQLTRTGTRALAPGAGGGPGCAPAPSAPAQPTLRSTNPRQRDARTTSKLAIRIKK